MASSQSKAPVLIALVNAVALLAAAGLLYYTKMVFKRPAITEHGERDRLEKIAESKPLVKTSSMLINFEPITVNIESVGGSRTEVGKLHFANIGFSLEISDSSRSGEIEQLKPILLDKLISILGRKKFQDLSSAQGRYVLRSEILNFSNDFLSNHHPKDAQQNAAPVLVTGVYFTEFSVQ